MQQRQRMTATAAALACLACAMPAHAAEIDTGNPDVVLRWDNTCATTWATASRARIRRSWPIRTTTTATATSPRAPLVANRLDLLSELDLVVDKKYGFRVSGARLDGRWPTAAWTTATTPPPTPWSTACRPRARCRPTPSAMPRARRANCSTPSSSATSSSARCRVSVRAGRHTVYWGESLLGGGAMHGISYGQYSLDLWKALATPGIEAKELYRPRNSMTVQVQPTPELALLGADLLRLGERALSRIGQLPDGERCAAAWRPVAHRRPEPAPAARRSRARPRRPATSASRRAGVPSGSTAPPACTSAAPPTSSRSWRWCPQWPPACPPPPARALGLRAARRPPPATSTRAPPRVSQIQARQVGQYRAFYGRDIDIFGLSLAKNIARHQRRRRTELPPQHAAAKRAVHGAARAAGQPGERARWRPRALTDDAPGARGNTMHGVFNLPWASCPRTPLFDAATWNAELVWSRWTERDSQNPGAFKGSDAYRANPANVDARQPRTTSAWASTSRRPGSRCSRAWTCRCR